MLNQLSTDILSVVVDYTTCCDLSNVRQTCTRLQSIIAWKRCKYYDGVCLRLQSKDDFTFYKDALALRRYTEKLHFENAKRFQAFRAFARAKMPCVLYDYRQCCERGFERRNEIWQEYAFQTIDI